MLIHRYMSFYKFVELVETGNSYLTSILLWDDPYETYIYDNFSSPSDSRIDPELASAIRDYEVNSIYAQSWTHGKESDALWRIYSQDNKGVRITAEAEQVNMLINSHLNHHPYYKNFKKNGDDIIVNHYKVQYGKEFDQNSAWGPNRRYDLTDKLACEHKREAFFHEKEYRFSCSIPAPIAAQISKEPTFDNILSTLKSGKADSVLPYSFPVESLKKVVLDPRSPDHFVPTFLSYCKNRELTIKGVEVKQSNLYRAPQSKYGKKP